MPVMNINNKTSFSAGIQKDPDGIKLHKVDDNTLKDWAWAKPQHDIKEVAKNSAKVMFVGVPLVDTFLSAAAKEGSLSKRVSTAAKTSAKWTAAIGAAGVLIGIKRALNSKTEKANKFSRKHPVLSFATDCAAIVGLYAGALLGGKKVGALVKDKHAKTFENTKNVLKNTFNNSIVNNKIVKPFNEFIAKHPYSNKALKVTSVVAAPVMVVSAYMRYKNELNDALDTARTNYKNLKYFNSLLPDKEQKETEEV